MTETHTQSQSLSRLEAAFLATSRVRKWAEGAELLTLVRAAHRSGLLQQLTTPTDLPSIAAQTGLPQSQLTNILQALKAAEVLEPADSSMVLTPGFRALVEGVSGIELAPLLDSVRLQERHVAQAVSLLPAEYPTGADALILARAFGLRSGPDAQALYSTMYSFLPEYLEALERGGPLLDVGCGVGGALLNSAMLFEKLHAVGVEVIPEVADEARRRVDALGLASRVEVRCIDSRNIEDRAVFQVAFWAQPFFATEARAATLAAIVRALRPSGLLMMQELFPSSDDPDSATAREMLDQLIYRQWGIPYGRSAEQLAEEAEHAGLERCRIAESPLGRLIVMRKPPEPSRS